MKDLVKLEFNVEKKVEEELIQSGFKIRKRVFVPRWVERIIGKIEWYLYA